MMACFWATLYTSAQRGQRMEKPSVTSSSEEMKEDSKSCLLNVAKGHDLDGCFYLLAFQRSVN